jgi:DGQHR domain-containing protein
MTAQDLWDISYADVRRPEGRDIEAYIGTQRDLSTGRVSEIKQYVTTIDACFPTSIILSIDGKDAEYNEKNKTIRIRRESRVAKIIDGQHRIAGLEGYSGPDFGLNVTVFIDMDIEDQALVFATINLKQTKVSKSLAYDLYEYAKNRSPQKTCHNIAKLMNTKEGSPFLHRIKILGKATGLETELITQATFVDRLLKLISTDQMDDRDRIKRGKELERITGTKAEKLVFRDRFVDEKDAEIAKILWNYFKAVSLRWEMAWNTTEKGMILARTTGFAALMRVFPQLYKETNGANAIPSHKEFLEHLQRCPLTDGDFNSDRYKPGATGEGKLVSDLEETFAKAQLTLRMPT